MEQTWKDPGTIRPPENGPEPAPAPCPECGETAGHLLTCRADTLASLRKAAAYAIADVDGGTSLVEHADNVLALLDDCAALRSQLAEAQGESLAYQAQLDAAREALPPDLLAANDGYVHEAIAHLWRGFSTERGTLDGVLGELAALRARVAELEAQHDADTDAFASGRRYERTWYGLRAAELEQVVIGQRDVLLAMKAERDQLAATVERVRAKAAAWKDEARQVADMIVRDRDDREGYAEAQVDCADELEAILPPKVSP